MIQSAVANFGRVGIALFLFLSVVTAVDAATGKDSKLCREVAANKWLLDFTMEHGNPTYEQQLEAIRQVSQYSELVRKACGDNRINNEILQSAKNGTWPDWIESEVRELLAQLGG
jgi:hypothetical protein